jgi:ribonuclease HI
MLISDTLSIFFRKMGTHTTIGWKNWMIWVHKNVFYRSMRSVGWIFSLKSASGDMSLERFWALQGLTDIWKLCFPVFTPLELRTGIALFSPSNLFYTDGSLMDGAAGFALHQSIHCNIGFRMRGPVSVFTAELPAIRMAMDHIENEALGWDLILTDSMSSIRAMESQKISLHTHPFVYECQQKCWQLIRSGREVNFMWVPVHVGIAGNEKADFEARQATLGNMVYNVQSVTRDLLPVAKQRMLDEWQKIWEVAETGRFSYSRPWFDEWRMEDGEKTYNDCLEDYLGALQS